jgi:hypothetical protein
MKKSIRFAIFAVVLAGLVAAVLLQETASSLFG